MAIKAKAESSAHFVEIDTSTLTSAQQKLLAAKTEADIKHRTLKVQFETSVRESAVAKGMIDNVTTTMVFAYGDKFGGNPKRLVGAIVPKTDRGSKAKPAKEVMKF